MGKRLLFLNYEYPPIGGGGGTTTAFLAEQMTARGHHVYVLTGGIPDHLGLERVNERLTVERLYTTRRRADVCSKLQMSLYVARASLVLRNRLKRFKPDLVHVFFSFPTGGVLWFHHLFMKQPYLVSLLGGDVPGFLPRETGFYHRLIHPFTKRLWRHAAAVVANSIRLGELGEKAVGPPVQVIPNGVDTKVFFPGDKPAQEKLSLVFVGRLAPQKGLDVLLEALGRVKSALPPWRLTIVGDGPYRGHYRQLADDLGLADHLNWLGWVPFDKLPDIYREHAVFVLPSRYEGMPSVIAQAMACGCVVLSCDVFGAEELVADGKSGFIVPVEDPHALGDKLRDLSDHNRLAAMREVGIDRAQCFSTQTVADRYESLYGQALQSRS